MTDYQKGLIDALTLLARGGNKYSMIMKIKEGGCPLCGNEWSGDPREGYGFSGCPICGHCI